MTVRAALLTLLEQGPRHGYQLKAEFDDLTGQAWPLNYGQVYTTLQRLEKAGAVASLDEDHEGRVRYEVTESGRAEVADWLDGPVQQPLGSRDEIALKVLVAVHLGHTQALSVIDVQRSATMSTLQSVTKLKADGGDLAWLLHLDRTAMLAEAELRWLDLAEDRLGAQPDGAPMANRAETEPSAEPSDKPRADVSTSTERTT